MFSIEKAILKNIWNVNKKNKDYMEYEHEATSSLSFTVIIIASLLFVSTWHKWLQI